MNCFLRAKKAIRKYSTVAGVKTSPFVKTFIICYLTRGNIWRNEVHPRLLTCNDLVVKEASYHIFCINCFRLQKIPLTEVVENL